MESDYLDKGGNLYICYTITSYIIVHHAYRPFFSLTSVIF